MKHHLHAGSLRIKANIPIWPEQSCDGFRKNSVVFACYSPRKVVAEIGMQIESSAKAVAKLTDMDYESASENDIESDADAPLLLDKIPSKGTLRVMCACVCAPSPQFHKSDLDSATFCHYVILALAFLWLSSINF